MTQQRIHKRTFSGLKLTASERSGPLPNRPPGWHYHLCKCEDMHRKLYPRSNHHPTSTLAGPEQRNVSFLRDASHINYQQRFRAKREQRKIFDELNAEAAIWPWLSYLCHVHSIGPIPGSQKRRDELLILACFLRHDLIRRNIHDEYSCSIKIATRLNHISHCKAAVSGTNWSNRWTYRAFIIDARRDEVADFWRVF